MRKALKRAAHVLLAAGALGVARPAAAQPPATSAKGPAAKPVAGSVAPASMKPAADAGRMRLEELQVELALLSNPATFGHVLGCKHTGTKLEVHGFVPNESVRAQALEIAKQHCDGPVADMIQVNGALAPRLPAGTADELQQGAKALLAETFGRAAAGLEIKAGTQGRVVVSGTCDSYEQKVAVSKKLRGLRGCCAVDNRVTVKPVLRDGRMVLPVTADGSCTVAAPGCGGGAPIQTAWNFVETPPPAAGVPVKTAAAPGGKGSETHESRPVRAAYTTTGVAVFDDDLSPPLLMNRYQLVMFKHKVEAVCGALAKDVVVTTAPDGVVHVLVKTIDRCENDKLKAGILELPEMAAPNVRLEVRPAN
jgi:hypothetical protein